MRYPAGAPTRTHGPTRDDEDRPEVSKRTRGAHRTPGHRPGQRGRPDGRTHLAPAEPTSAGVSEVAAGAPPPTVAESASPAAANAMRGGRVRPNSLLAVRAAEEYVYVAQDIRRIAVVALGLFGLLFAIWIALELLGIPGRVA